MYATLYDVLKTVSCFEKHKILNANTPSNGQIQAVEILRSFVEEPKNSVLYIFDENSGDFSYTDFAKFIILCERKLSTGILVFPSQVEHMIDNNEYKKSELEKMKVPIILVDSQYSSLYLSNEILKSIYNIIADKFKSMIDINTTYAKKALKNEGLHSMITYFKEIVHNPIAVYDENFKCIEATDSYLESYISVKSTAKSFYLNNLYFLKQRIILKIDDSRREYSFVHFPISFENKVKAYLAVLEVNDPLTEIDYLTIEIAATAILMEMKHRLAIRSIEEKNINNFIYDLLYQKEQREDDILKEATVLGLLLDSNYIVFVIDLFTGISQNAEHGSRTLLSETLKDKMFSFISKYFKNINNRNIIGTLGKSIIVLYTLENIESDSHTKIKSQCEKLSKELKAHYENCKLFFGIGNIVEGIHSVTKSYKNARMALSYGRIISNQNDGFIIHYKDASILKLISSIGSPTELEAIIPDSLRALCEYDSSNHTELFETLSAYLNSNCNAKLASEKMFIHYKTMLYRLDRISEIFHIDLNNSDQRLDLTLGVKILSVLSK